MRSPWVSGVPIMVAVVVYRSVSHRLAIAPEVVVALSRWTLVDAVVSCAPVGGNRFYILLWQRIKSHHLLRVVTPHASLANSNTSSTS